MTHLSKLQFWVDGIPRPQGSKRYIGNGRFVEASAVKPWRKAIAKTAEAAMTDSGLERFDDAVAVSAVFVLPRPKTVKRIWPTVAPDLDKLQRALGDGMTVDTNTVLTDDSMIVHWRSFKVYGERPGVWVEIRSKFDEEEQFLQKELRNVLDIKE
jgi:Holliday junction resolvase RusA-like endonuclease